MAPTAHLCSGHDEAVGRAQRSRRLSRLRPLLCGASEAPLHKKLIRCDAVRDSGADVQSRRHNCQAARVSAHTARRTLQSLQCSEGAATAPTSAQARRAAPRSRHKGRSAGACRRPRQQGDQRAEVDAKPSQDARAAYNRAVTHARTRQHRPPCRTVAHLVEDPPPVTSSFDTSLVRGCLAQRGAHARALHRLREAQQLQLCVGFGGRQRAQVQQI